MSKALLSSSLLPSLQPGGAARLRLPLPLPSLRRHGGRRASACRVVRASLHGLDSIGGLDLHAALERAEAALYTLADAAVVAADAAAGGGGGGGGEAGAVAQKNGGWFGFISEALEVVLKVLKDGLSAVHVPYAYGFAIILLTVIVKAATLPLTKQQVESTLAMQNLQPQIKAIQQRYAGNQERIQLETARLYKQAGVNPLAGCFPTLATIPVWIGLYQALSNVANEGLLTEGFFWIPSLGGPTTIAARQSGAGISWLLPFVDGHPPLGWHDTICYLVLPVLLVVSQFVSMEIMKPPQTDDPSQKNTLLVLKFLPFMIGAIRTVHLLDEQNVRVLNQPNLLKEEESKRKGNKALAAGDSDLSASTSEDEESDDETTEEGGPEERYNSSSNKKLPNYSGKKGKRSKRKRMVNSVGQYGCVVYPHNFDDQLGRLIFKCRTDTKHSSGTGVLLAHIKMKIVQYTTIGLRG
uniref:Membrane insertase YidC/Oxa/ALB C-terminal domain-containing protein n=1 Tax=Oryza punctata TaxID=4537 RepID=A0A0E0JE40_ORYPU